MSEERVAPATNPVWLRSLGAKNSAAVADEDSLERETLQRERRWVFVNEVPFVCKELKSKIDKALEALSPSSFSALQKKNKPIEESKEKEKEKEKENPYTEVIPAIHFETAEQVMRGAMRIEGWNVLEAEFLIKSAKWNKSTPFRTIVGHLHPMKLFQLHNCYNFLKNALEIIQKLEKLVAATKEIDRHVEDIRVNKIMEDVSRNLKSAMEELLFGVSAFPDGTLFSPTVFQPYLPQDLLIECNISNKELLVNCYCLHILQNKPQKLVRHSTPPKIGDILNCSRNGVNYWVEVVDVARSRLPNERIANIFTLTNAASQLCTEMRDKLSILL